MTIEEYKEKLDAYLGMTGELSVNDRQSNDKWAEHYIIKYASPTGMPLCYFHIVRSKIHKMPHGWYESGSGTETLPRFDPDTKLNHEAFCEHMRQLKAQGK